MPDQLIRGKFGNFFQYCEVKFQLFVCALFTPVLAVFLVLGGFAGGVGQGLRDGIFQAATALTTTGFQTVPSFAVWSSPLILLMTLLMLIDHSRTGACRSR